LLKEYRYDIDIGLNVQAQMKVITQ